MWGVRITIVPHCLASATPPRRTPALVEPRNLPPRAGAVGIEFAGELRAQQRYLCADARHDRHDWDCSLLFTSSSHRADDRDLRLGVIGLLMGYLPAYTDRHEFFRFSGLVAIQPGLVVNSLAFALAGR